VSEVLLPTSQLDPVLLASRWICGDILPENIPQMAIQLIEAGVENAAVYRVAAEDKVYSRDQIERLVARMFLALNVPYPIAQESARGIVARQIAREVIAGLKDPWLAAAQLDRVVPHWETEDKNIWAIYGITDEVDWDSGYGRNPAILELELVKTFRQLACS
jgi:hypothetical protein